MTDETQLSQELTRRAQGVHDTTLTLEDVRGRARSIRRRRAAGVAAVAAVAVLAIVVPTTLMSGGGSDSAPDPAPPAPTGRGAAVLHDGTLTLPDGGIVALDVDNADVSQLGLLTDGRIVLAMTEPRGVRVYAPDGTLQEDYAADPNAITMSPDDEAVAWLERDGSVQVLASNQAEPTELGTVEVDPLTGAMVDAVVDAGRVLVGNGNTTTTEVTAAGVSELATSEPLRVTDVSPDGDLWAVQYADDADPQFGCVGLYDPAAALMVARNCETAGLRFAPDGQHLLGMRGDNNMYGDATVLDLDLQRVGGWVSEGKGDVIHRAAWADAEHVLVSETNWETSTWSLSRVDLAWTEREVLDGPAEGRNPESVAEYLLSE